MILHQDGLEDFLSRFASFNDGIVRNVAFGFHSAVAGSTIAITLSVKDSRDGNGWSNLLLTASDVEEVVFREVRSTVQILSDGIHIGWFDGLIYCDLCPFSPPPESPDEVRKSSFYFFARAVSYEVRPYQE